MVSWISVRGSNRGIMNLLGYVLAGSTTKMVTYGSCFFLLNRVFILLMFNRFYW